MYRGAYSMEVSLEAVKKSITKFMLRYHFIIFFVVIAGGLSAGIVFLSNAIAASDQPNDYVSTVNSITFDETTIERLNQLKEPGQTTEKIRVNGRGNPF